MLTTNNLACCLMPGAAIGLLKTLACSCTHGPLTHLVIHQHLSLSDPALHQVLAVLGVLLQAVVIQPLLLVVRCRTCWLCCTAGAGGASCCCC